MELKDYLKEKQSLIENELPQYLKQGQGLSQNLDDAMQYSLMAGGKRLRPILVLAGCESLGGNIKNALPSAIALEMIHTYSLIHDDLPAMDDDDLRRGKATNHKVFGEANAILAGDALLTLAFETVARTEIYEHGAGKKLLRVVQILAKAAGSLGMVGGQALDLEGEGKKLDYDSLKKIHAHKTGCLIRVAVEIGGLIAGGNAGELIHLRNYGEKIGLAFQIADDILDIEGGEDLGKDIGSDLENEKATYPKLLGMDKSKALCKETVAEAIQSLEKFDERAEPLRAIARYVIERRN